MSVLTEILAHKAQEVARRARNTPIESLRQTCSDMAECRGFMQALHTKKTQQAIGVIAEVKKASPSKGLIRADFDPAWIAQSYAAGGATCLSVLTDEKYFQGSDAYLQQAQAAVALPILRKDFVVDEYQIWESRALGADCILLIVAGLSDSQLHQYYQLAHHVGLDALIEVHNADELERALSVEPTAIGVNNRNLHTFETRLETTEELALRVPPDTLLICESGIHSPDDIVRMRRSHVQSFLIGESFMRAANPGKALAEFIAT